MGELTMAPGVLCRPLSFDTTGHASTTTLLHVALPIPLSGSAMVSAHTRAVYSNRESDWGRFVDEVWKRRADLSDDETAWLLDTCWRAISFREKEALLRAVFLVAEVDRLDQRRTLYLLEDGLRQPSAELRLVALEGLIELMPEHVDRFDFLKNDPHPDVRRAFTTAQR